MGCGLVRDGRDWSSQAKLNRLKGVSDRVLQERSGARRTELLSAKGEEKDGAS